MVLGEVFEYRWRDVKGHMVSASGNDTGLEDPKPHFFSERTHLDHESASQARANPLVETFKIIRRPDRQRSPSGDPKSISAFRR